nr:bifunctional diguanylate cyclase/phosphodiesterase [Legionella norrlandica]
MSDEKKDLIVFNIRIFDAKTMNSLLDYSPDTRDEIILEAVARIERSSPKKMFIARIGFSEFIVVYFTQNKLEFMVSVAKQMIEKLSSPYHIHNQTFILQTIIGLTVYYKNTAFSAEDLLQQSEIARRQAQNNGVNIFKFFDPRVEEQIIEFNKRLESVRKAIQLNELEMHYQPIVDLKTRKAVSLEALLRWRHPDKGLLLPKQFLDDLDNHPLSLQLGEWALHQVLHQIEKLLELKISIPISINVGAYQLQYPDFVKKLFNILEKYPKVPANLIKLEIIETEAIEDLSLVSQIIQECKDKEVYFSLDDFGTGYSSLNFLKEFNTHEVKIDQSFVSNILDKPKDLAILKVMIEFCKVVGRVLVAEGVETIAHGKLLHLLGCTLVQGYAIARPMSAAELIPWLKTWRLGSEWGENRFSRKILKELVGAAIKHYLILQSIGFYIQNYQYPKPKLASQACPIERWLLKNQQQFQDNKKLKIIYDMHQKQHELGSEIIQLIDLGQKEQAYKQLACLDDLRSMLLKELVNAIFLG